MTVKQLIQKLSKLNPDLEVKIENLGASTSGDVVDVEDVFDFEYDENGSPKSCEYVSIQARHMD